MRDAVSSGDSALNLDESDQRRRENGGILRR
jgi:hypothetical protein